MAQRGSVITSPGGPAAPLHVHVRDSETFCVLEGELTLFVGDEVVKASAGDVVYAPAGGENGSGLQRKLDQICSQSADVLRKQLGKIKVAELATRD